MDKKINLLVIPDDYTGVSKFRSVGPHTYLQEHYSDEFNVDIIYLKDFPKENLDNFLKKYDLIQIHKQLDKDANLMDLCEFLQIPVIVDVDDYYKLGDDHPMHISAVNNGWSSIILKHIKKAFYVTTTTQIYADDLKTINPNVEVIPNAIDVNESQFTSTKTNSSKLRFGIICGSTHLPDIKLMENISNLPKDVLNKIQFELCGFDTNGTLTIYDKSTGEVRKRPIKPEESVWSKYEEILTNGYRNVSSEHKDFLKFYFKNVEDPYTNESYVRHWTKNINSYGTHYNNVDVLLAPLKVNMFNKMKSQLKAIEAGFTNTAIIAQNYGPYTIDLIPMINADGSINENGNALLVDTNRNNKQWNKYITTLVNNRDMVSKLSNNLHRDMTQKYNLEDVTKKRVDFYKMVIEKYKNK